MPAMANDSTATLNEAAKAALEGKEVTKGYRLSLDRSELKAALAPPDRRTESFTIPAGKPLILRINAGMDMGGPGWRYVDADGNAWLPDRRWREGAQWGVEGGDGYLWSEKDLNLPESQPNPSLYRTAHFDPDVYRFHLPDGSYTVKLHFQENADPAELKSSGRMFDVGINDETVLERFVPLAAAGGEKKPVIETFENIEPVDGGITVRFEPRTEKSAFVNAIEIIGQQPLEKDYHIETGDLWMSDNVPSLPPCPGEVIGRYLCGVGDKGLPGFVLETDDGAVWIPDSPHTAKTKGFWAEGGGAGRVHDGIHFLNTPNPQIYRYQRFGGNGYQIVVPEPGKYGVRLHFAEGSEVNATTTQRIFQVLAENEVVLEKVHPMMDGGGFAMPAVFEVRGIDVADGQLSIAYNNLQHHSAISAIELFRDPEGPDTAAGKQIAGPAVREPLTPVNDSEPLRVLYVGNSHTFFWDMPGTVAASVATLPGSTIQLDPYAYLRGGRTLNFFSTSARIEKRPSVFDVMRAGKYDVVNLQIFSVRAPEAVDKMLEGLAEFAEVAKETDTAIVLYCFHPIDSLEPAARETFDRLVKENRMTVIPFGDVRRHFMEQISSTPLHFDLDGVGVHLGFHPAYLNTCIHTIAWTGKSPVDHPFPTLVGQDSWVTGEQARFLQTSAWEGWRVAREKYGLRSFPENDSSNDLE